VRTVRRTAPPLCALLTLASIAGAQILSPEAHFGFVMGADRQLAGAEAIERYFELIAAHSDRVRIVDIGPTTEGRRTIAAIVSAPDNIRNLEQIRLANQRLADPRTLSPADAERLVKELPVVTWLSHGVHGNEISSSDAALFEAYHLLASQGDADVDTVLRESLVLIDPMQNPDGRARFVFQNLQGRAAHPDATPYNAEHDEPWPGGRSNHYLFDMNRDWFAQSQPETRGRITLAREY